MNKTLLIIAFAILILTIAGAFNASAAPSKPVDQKTFNALMNRLHPDGKGVSSTSRARGYYRGSGGNWRSR